MSEKKETPNNTGESKGFFNGRAPMGGVPTGEVKRTNYFIRSTPTGKMPSKCNLNYFHWGDIIPKPIAV